MARACVSGEVGGEGFHDASFTEFHVGPSHWGYVPVQNIRTVIHVRGHVGGTNAYLRRIGTYQDVLGVSGVSARCSYLK